MTTKLTQKNTNLQKRDIVLKGESLDESGVVLFVAVFCEDAKVSLAPIEALAHLTQTLHNSSNLHRVLENLGNCAVEVHWGAIGGCYSFCSTSMFSEYYLRRDIKCKTPSVLQHAKDLLFSSHFSTCYRLGCSFNNN